MLAEGIFVCSSPLEATPKKVVRAKKKAKFKLQTKGT